MQQLANELVPIVDPVLADPKYRKDLACSLLYKVSLYMHVFLVLVLESERNNLLSILVPCDHLLV